MPEVGLCQCGCGQKTSIATRNRTKPLLTKGQPRHYLSGHCNTRRNFKTGRTLNKGYVHVLDRKHPRAHQNGYVLESVLIAEKALGKLLPEKAVVHHHTPEQPVICQDQSYHMLLHARQRALRTCGHADWRKCKFCKIYDSVNKLVYCSKNRSFYHANCERQDQRERYYKRVKSKNKGERS